MRTNPNIGFTCAYTPVQLIHAAGFAPYRILPMGQADSQAGTVLHDNLCPHVKQVLDRVLAGEIPDLAAMVIMNSCEAMRRLADALASTRPEIPVIMVDLPSEATDVAVSHFRSELIQLFERLNQLASTTVTMDHVVTSIGTYNQLIKGIETVRDPLASSPRGYGQLQKIYNLAVTTAPEKMFETLDKFADIPTQPPKGIPIYLFGNLLCDPEAFEMFEHAGCQILGDDLCTGLRQLTAVLPNGTENQDLNKDPMGLLAKALLNRAPCGRTVRSDRLPHLAQYISEQVDRTSAKGAIAHVMKFCDPYLARLPAIRQRLRQKNIPLLVLESDGTLGAIGQQRTRLEAFVETLEGGLQ